MLPIAETYQKEVFKPMTETIKGIGKALGPRPSRKAVDISQYQGVADNVQRSFPKTIPKSISDIGRVSVQPGGSTRYERVHPGVDIANITGTPIPSFTGGKVSEIVSGKRQGDQAFGNYIIVTDGGGNKHRYSHLSGSYVSLGQQVSPGTPIGAMGRSGQVYSPSGNDPSHLDYRIKSAAGAYLNPYNFIR